MTQPVVTRSSFSNFESAVSGMFARFKSKLDQLASMGSGVSTVALIQMQYDSSMMQIITETSSAIMNALKSSAQSITQKL